MLLLPWTLEQTIHGAPDENFQCDLVFSAINGYHYIRFIDDLMDGDVPPPRELLPALSFLYLQAHTVYQRYFPFDHPFWQTYASCWQHCADVTAADASLDAVDRGSFVDLAAQKTSAAKIPIAAVCWRYGRADLYADWARFHDTLGCWHQMTNDVRDWQADLTHNTATYFVSEALRRKRQNEAVVEWIVREGYAWAAGELEHWMAQMKEQAHALGSGALLAYLDARERLQAERHEHYLGVVLPRIADLRLAIVTHATTSHAIQERLDR